ncbi:MAG TPA: hypothetical protein VHK90_15460 [Thermoanaerobaculia bacterium]|nr:hypothetical protein [Thermoanaerobaculia bacterium]
MFALDENPDLSRRAVDLDWPTPLQTIDETREPIRECRRTHRRVICAYA